MSANVVTPEFFRVFGIDLVRGRGLTVEDRLGAEPVAVVDETLARAYFGPTDPLGRRVSLGADREPFTIVGVVRSARLEDLRDEPSRTIYTALAQSRLGSAEQVGDARRLTVVLRSASNPALLPSMVRDEVTQLSSRVVVSYVRTMEEQFDAAMMRERLMAALSVGYGGLALLLSLVGLYGITAFGVARQTHDIGIRMALGATRRRVVRGILRETMVTSASGVAVGGAASLIAANLVEPFLFQVPPQDPATLIGVMVLLTVTTLFAGYLPGRQAASIDPARALKGS